MEPMTTLEFHAIRNTCGLSTADLGQILGVNPRTVRSWEQGRMPIREKIAAEMRALADEHAILVDQFEAADPPIILEFPKDYYRSLGRPREWYVTALGAALSRWDGLRAEWVGEPESHALDSRLRQSG